MGGSKIGLCITNFRAPLQSIASAPPLNQKLYKSFPNPLRRILHHGAAPSCLVFMLGMTPSIGHFFGLPLDVRHVTLSTGTLGSGNYFPRAGSTGPWRSDLG